MDGNDRWSRKQKISKYTAYKKGATKLMNLSTFIFKNYDIKYISAFALSVHNIKRSGNFFKLFLKVFKECLNEIDKSKIDFKVKFNGNLNCFNQEILKLIKSVEKNTSNYKKELHIFLNYSGQIDIINAINSHSSKIYLKKSDFKKTLSTKDLPDPDIMIRSGGFQRLSDFLLYQISFTELFFLKKLWPDVSNTDIKKIIEKYYKIEKKFGL